MPTINSKTKYRNLSSVNKMLDKYGHACTVVVSDSYPPVPATCLFTSNKLGFINETLVLNNDYKILVKAVTLPAPLVPQSKVVVNGVNLTATSVKKVTPDGANAIIWEIQASSSVFVPDDVSSIETPTVTSPATDTGFYPSTEGTSGWSIFCQGSTPVLKGDAEFISSEWEIAEDEAFTTVVATEVVTGANQWTTPDSLQRNTNYFVRVRYTASIAGTTDWSVANLFSLDAIQTAPVTRIEKPTILNQLNSSGEIIPNSPDRYLVYGKYPYSTTKLANVTIKASVYTPISAGAFASITFQIATDSGFTNLVRNLTQSTGFGYSTDTGSTWEVVHGFVEDDYPCTKGVTYYARVKYTSVDPYESEWSDTFTFKVNAVEDV